MIWRDPTGSPSAVGDSDFAVTGPSDTYASSLAARAYSIRPLRDGDEDGHIALMRAAGFEKWDREQLRNWREKALPEGVVVAEHPGEGRRLIVATAMASPLPTELHPHGGELGWVAAHPAHAGKGLGAAVCNAAIDRLLRAGYRRIYLKTDDPRLAAVKTYLRVVDRLLRAGYRRIYLKTDDPRLAAVKTYLRLGFVPFLFEDRMLDRWLAVFDALGLAPKPEHWERAPDERWVRGRAADPIGPASS
jgi:mycothiol synthase